MTSDELDALLTAVLVAGALAGNRRFENNDFADYENLARAIRAACAEGPQIDKSPLTEAEIKRSHNLASELGWDKP